MGRKVTLGEVRMTALTAEMKQGGVLALRFRSSTVLARICSDEK